MATKTKTTGFAVCCPKCHDEEPTVRIGLADMECSGTACDETFTVEEAVEQAAEQLRQWEKVGRWIEAAKQFAD